MVQKLIKPDKFIAKDFIGVIISFFNAKLRGSNYTDFRISDPFKTISADLSSIQFSSLASKEITPLWDCLQEAGLEITNLTPGNSPEKVNKFKVSLNFPKEFLLEYGNEKVKRFCEDFDSDDDPNQAGSVSSEDKLLRAEQNPSQEEILEDEGAETIETIEELIETISEYGLKQKIRTITQFFKWYFAENEINDYNVLARTGYKYQGNEPVFVVRILKQDEISKVLDLLQSQGCDVDIAGREQDVVRVKTLNTDGSQLPKDESKKVAKPNSKKDMKLSVKPKTKSPKKASKKSKTKTKHKTPSEIQKAARDAKPKVQTVEPESNLFTDRLLQEIAQITEDFLRKDGRLTEKTLVKFQQMIELKKQELDILNKLEKDFNDLVTIRKTFFEKYNS